jgi:lipopolysaccharide biosynthesis protein
MRLRRVLRARVLGESRSPAEYEAWKARGQSVDPGFPDDWVDRGDQSVRSGAQVAAVVHVFHLELLDELIDQLAAIPVPFDLIVTNATGSQLTLDGARLPQVRHCLILGVENRGRDLWPLVQVVNAGLIDSHELIVKVHTKRSDWRAVHAQLGGTGSDWRESLLAALLGDPRNVRAILDAFREDLLLGMVTADGSILGPEFWGQNERVTAGLLRRLDLVLQPGALVFPAGSMYWSRAGVLRRLRELRMSRDDFEAEAGQIDGTTAHALERVIGLLATDAGLRIVERSGLSQGGKGTS